MLIGVVQLGRGEKTGNLDDESNYEALQKETATGKLMSKFHLRHWLQHASSKVLSLP